MNFAGIGGSGVSADTVGVVPGYPGYGVGAIEYIAHMMADPKMANIPLLLCCAGMHALHVVIDCIKDCVYVGVDSSSWSPGSEEKKFLKLPKPQNSL